MSQPRSDARQCRPELLAPAGDWEALRAAVANGADAVYFGLSNFNARARAANFEPDELPSVMQFLHARNVRGFVTLNTLIFSDELPAVAEFVKLAAECGVDAVIVQDLGLVRLIRRMVPTLHVHASTQMTLTEPRGINFVRQLGVERVVLARELSLEDIRKVTAGTDMPVEVFVHGALCVAYSGQCLTSEALGGRSANRGQCAQACRLPYEMIVDGVARDLGDRAYLLSPQDLAAYDHIQPLIEAGVISFKIEGRLKGGPYVAATTQTYRKAIDTALEERDFQLSRRDELDLAQTFSRGFTPGFLEGNNHQKLVRGRFPKSRGVRLGKVVGLTKLGAKIQLAERMPVEEIIKPGDGVVFDIGKPEEKEPGGRVWNVQESRHDPLVIEIAFETGAINLSEVMNGCEVWKTDDPALRKRLEQSYAQDRPAHRLPLSAKVSGAVGGSVTLMLSNPYGITATATWSGPLELAQKRPTTAEEIGEQLGRLGDTPYELGALTIDLPASVLVPKSVLNDLRRQAAGELAERQMELRKHITAEPNALEAMRAELSVRTPTVKDGIRPDIHNTRLPVLIILARNLDQLEAVLNWQPPNNLPRPEAVYCDFEDLRRYKDAVARARVAGMPIGLAPVRILKPAEEGFQSLVVRAEPDIVLVRNLASISYFQKQLPKAQLVGDFSLNVANELTASLLRQAGLVRLVPSYDLNWDQFASLLQRSNPTWFEAVIHQHMPMFHMEHCVFAAFLSSGKDHRDCGRPCEVHKVELRDRVGANFPVLPDTGCRNTVFNSVAQSGAEYVGRMRELGVTRFRIDLLRETPEQVGPLLNRYARVVGGLDEGRTTWRELRALNQLGVTRGTLNLL
jgi:putative protease